MQPFTVVAVAAAAVTAPYHTPQAVDTEAPCKGEIPGVQIEDLCEGCISLSNAEGLGLLSEKRVDGHSTLRTSSGFRRFLP
ncbi:MAG: hypothetical protein ACLR6M_09115 [Acutalibacteraceae bacterium]